MNKQLSLEHMHQKTYILENLGCANCAAKMERKIQELSEVGSASITFATKQLRIEAADPEALVSEIQTICQSIESEVIVTEKESVSSTYVNGTASSVKNGFFSGHKADVITLGIGAILFASGAILAHIWGYDMWFAGGGKIVLLTLAIFISAYLILGHKVLLTAARNISHGQIFDENFLMSIATISAFCIGEFAEGVGVMLFYRVGQLFEDMAVERSRSQIMDAVDMRPETVMLIAEDEHEHCDCGCGHEHHDHGHHDDECQCGCGHEHVQQGPIRIVPAGDSKPGDILLVRPGDRIPLDGIVVEGESRIDTSPVTGEPVPVSVYPGDEVISGCINEHGVLKIRVTKPLSESMVTRILDSVENAAAGKPKIDRFITKFARIYTPIVVSLAVLTAMIPSLITGDWAAWIRTAITFLVISCPCALVISVPLAFFSGIGAASKLGILFKGGLAIEALKNIKAVVMDKTG
ncbi:MAG: heavy metal translocating P-type ATPase, partial [Firmicutes bacterium]|nr:heavy metal translocating P-type ATPase [Bacillota bacterium]